MSDDQEQKPKKKKTWCKRWTPRQFALYLMSINMKYVLPGTSNDQIMEEVPNLHCGIGKVSYLRNHKEFQDTVEEMFVFKIRSEYSKETMFWLYLKHCFNSNIDIPNPSARLLDVLGFLSGNIKSSVGKSKLKGNLTPEQKAKLIHQKEQIEHTLNSKTQFDTGEKDGEDGN